MPFHLDCPRPATRRGFLKRLTLGGAVLSIGRGATDASGADEPADWVALVSDTHIAANPTTMFLGNRTFRNFVH